MSAPLSPEEYETVRRFGLHRRPFADVVGMLRGVQVVAASLAMVLLVGLVVVVAILQAVR